MSNTVYIFIALIMLLLVISACSMVVINPTATPVPDQKILFIGNSFTFWNDGLEYHMRRLVNSADSSFAIAADATVMGGAPLEAIWHEGDARQSISTGDYDIVVLQEDLPETDVETFYEYARKFDAEIKEKGATPVLFMAWPYEELGWISMEEIAEAHREMGAELGLAVAPAGLAWERAMAERPRLDMYDTDKEHPSIHGTYLAVAVVYATLYDKDPSGLTYRPRGINKEEAAFLQRIAWESVQAYQVQ
ncbi:MAG: hypothetical protein AAF485_11105 [Chloroflexota bacterium]